MHTLSSAYLDGELDDARGSAFRGHLRVCERCAIEVADAQAIRRGAAELASARDPNLEPPPQLWDAISARLAAEEIADSDVAGLRLRMRSFWAAFAPYRAHVAVALALVIVGGALLLKESRDYVLVSSRGVTSAPGPVFASDASDSSMDEMLGETQLEQAIAEIRRADDRYLTAIGELRELANEERESWTASAKARFDRAVSDFEEQAGELRRTLEDIDRGDPRSRDPLYEIYRRYIKFLEDSVFDQVSAIGGGR